MYSIILIKYYRRGTSIYAFIFNFLYFSISLDETLKREQEERRYQREAEKLRSELDQLVDDKKAAVWENR